MGGLPGIAGTQISASNRPSRGRIAASRDEICKFVGLPKRTIVGRSENLTELAVPEKKYLAVLMLCRQQVIVLGLLL